MPTPRRRERLASLIEEIVSELLQREIKDPRVSGMTSITRVEVSADVSQARIYVSVMGDETVRRDTMRALEHASGFIRSKLGQELTIRHVPAVLFQLDRSLEEGDRVLALINEIGARTPPAPPDPAADAEPDDGTKESGAAVASGTAVAAGGANSAGAAGAPATGAAAPRGRRKAGRG